LIRLHALPARGPEKLSRFYTHLSNESYRRYGLDPMHGVRISAVEATA
jgi:hypothetical protein